MQKMKTSYAAYKNVKTRKREEMMACEIVLLEKLTFRKCKQ